MCNQTEMWKEISDYDERASRGEVHIRGIAHRPETCPKCIKDKKKAARQEEKNGRLA